MMKNSSKGTSGWAVALWIVTGLVLVCAYGLAVYLGGQTLTPLWIPWSVVGALSIASGLVAWKIWCPLTGCRKVWLNFLLNIAVAAGILSGAIFSLNYWLAEESSDTVVTAAVTARYSETRHYTRRLGRRLSARGNPYKVYFVRLALPGGREKDFRVDAGQYNRLRNAAEVDLTVEEGFLFMPVVKEFRIKGGIYRR